MSALTRTVVAAVFALALAFVPVFAGTTTGGEGGFVNLPGSRSAFVASGVSLPRLSVVKPTTEKLQLRLPPNMPNAVAVIMDPDGAVVVMRTNRGVFTLSANDMRAVTKAGITTLDVVFVDAVPQPVIVKANLKLSAKDKTVTITVE